MTTQAIGGWTGFVFTISSEQEAVFKTAMNHFVGVNYTPVAVAQQVVSGMNYCFLCKAVPVYPNAHEYAAEVYIYKPLQGDPHITQIHRVDP